MSGGNNRRRGSKELETQAAKILAVGFVVDLGSHRYRVSSQSSLNMYYDVVRNEDNIWKCSCAYCTNRRGTICKHIIAAQSFAERIRAGMLEGAEKIEVGEAEVACDRCHSRDYRYRETRKKKDGVSIMYRCLNKKCGKKFVHAPGFKGRHYSIRTITDALLQVASGMSPAAVSQWLEKNEKRVNSGTIRRWMKHYGALLKKLVDAVMAPRTGRDWSADELHFLSVGESIWMFGVMDTKSRAMIHYEQSRTKMGYDAASLLEKAVALAGKFPDALTTDKLHGFAKGFKKAISKKAGRGRRPIHRRDAGIAKVHINNNTYERFNGTLKGALRAGRGFRTESPALLVLFMAHYNLFRPHGGLGGRTPAEALGVSIRGPDKWKTAIQYAAQHL